MLKIMKNNEKKKTMKNNEEIMKNNEKTWKLRKCDRPSSYVWFVIDLWHAFSIITQLSQLNSHECWLDT